VSGKRDSSAPAACHPHSDTLTLRRYARHLVLPEIGEAGQRKLAASSVLIAGAGGLGSPLIAYLAAAGIGRLVIADGDRVELSNLQRQVIYETGDIGRLKTEAARDRAEELNPDCAIELLTALTQENAAERIGGVDIVADGTDNFEARFAIHDACYHGRKILVSAAVIGFSGQLSTFKAHLGAPHPCYRCFVSTQPPRDRSCSQEGVLGAAAGVMGALQAVEVIKELLGIGDSLSGSVMIYDALAAGFRKVALVRDPACPLCGAAGVKGGLASGAAAY
jgi:molybdopterin/thiamine biosynthesis adenylyltransferase